MKALLLLCAVGAIHAQTVSFAPGAKRTVIRGGEYLVSEPIVLDERHSGMTVEAAPGETVTFYGGRRITGWRQEGDRLWSAEAPADFRMLTVNGRRAHPARLPAAGFFTHESEFKVRWMGTSGGGWQRKPTEQELNTLKYKPDDLGPWLDLAGAELTVYHMWDESLVRLRAHDPATRTLTFANPAGHPPGAFNVQRYVVWNLREGMTSPGQWYLDRAARRVYYWPRVGEDMARAEALAPLVESIIRIEKAKDITLRGLRFAVTNTPPVAGGFGAGKFDGAVSLTDADGCTLEGLTVFNTGGQGIKAQNSRGLKVVNCEVRDTGACGIIARGEGAEITDNHVHHVGATYPSAIGIFCGGKNLLIAHNEVHDTPYTAVNCGGAGHRIENNLIYRAMLELHDGAAFYTIFGKGIVLRGNLVRDIPDTGGYGSSSYYLDELSEDCLVEGNVSVGVARPSHNHLTKPNTIRNNIFLYDGDMRITCPRSQGLRFENNVLAAKGKITIANPDAIAESAANIFWSGARVVEGAPAETLLADPRVEVQDGRYGFAPGSPAVRLGIAPVDVSAAGRRKK